jgi:hypothetical protein
VQASPEEEFWRAIPYPSISNKIAIGEEILIEYAPRSNYGDANAVQPIVCIAIDPNRIGNLRLRLAAFITRAHD